MLWSLLSLSVGIEMVDYYYYCCCYCCCCYGCSLDSVENVIVDHDELQLIPYWSRNHRTCSILQNGKHDREGHPWNQLENEMENHNRIRYLHHQVQDNLDRHVLSSRKDQCNDEFRRKWKANYVCNRHVLFSQDQIPINWDIDWRENENRCTNIPSLVNCHQNCMLIESKKRMKRKIK